jgi:ADP-dependent NAD(P)H-hydrate dehydratase / NAD(P)H-hydrate epimerase
LPEKEVKKLRLFIFYGHLFIKLAHLFILSVFAFFMTDLCNGFIKRLRKIQRVLPPRPQSSFLSNPSCHNLFRKTCTSRQVFLFRTNIATFSQKSNLYMMKILNVEKIRQADAYTIQNEPISSLELMERAAAACLNWIMQRFKPAVRIKLICGPGNNGGDGLALARMLEIEGYSVEVFALRFGNEQSEDFLANMQRLSSRPEIIVNWLNSGDALPDFEESDLIVDAVFGSGLSRPVEGFGLEIIRQMNTSPAQIISIDISSGLFADASSIHNPTGIVQAGFTLSFEFPKLAFLIPENELYTGEWHILTIGLHPEFLRKAETINYFLTKQDITTLIRPRPVFAHKGNFGHALLIAGSTGKMGAAVLAARACLRAGVGLLTAQVPSKGIMIMPLAVPECMTISDTSSDIFTSCPDLAAYSAIGVGPGIGTDEQTRKALKLLIQEARKPMILDADALNILSENKTWLAFLPAHSILTPHPKEFERLAGRNNDDFERLESARNFAVKFTVYLVLKGKYTAICCPDGQCFFNNTGNAGMATGGSGDVLTGIILGLLAKGYQPKDAALLGVYLHGRAGDLAARDKGQESMLASDITEHLGEAFLELEVEYIKPKHQ